MNFKLLEDTYCRQDVLLSQPIVVWLMDTVDGSGRDAMRYLSWADVYIIVSFLEIMKLLQNYYLSIKIRISLLILHGQI